MSDDELLHGGQPGIDEGGPEEGHVFERETGSSPRAELVVAALVGGCALAALAFVVVFFALPDETQLLGLALGLALALLGAALVVAAKKVVPREQAIEERPELAQPQALPPVERTLDTPASGVSRRKLLAAAGGAAGATLAAAVAVPIA